MAARYAKSDVKYKDDAGKDAKEKCVRCYWWLGKNVCDMVKGHICPGGWCWKYLDNKKGKEAMS
jgi:hypothetical protein